MLQLRILPEAPQSHGQISLKALHGQTASRVWPLTYQHSAEIPAKLVKDSPKVLGCEDLAANQEEDSDGSELDDPGGDGHHGVRQAGEEIQERLPLFSNIRQSNPKNDRKENQSENVGAPSPLPFELPGKGVVWVSPLTGVVLH